MHFKMLSAICFNLNKTKILQSGNWLRYKIAHVQYYCKLFRKRPIFDSSKLKEFAEDNFK